MLDMTGEPSKLHTFRYNVLMQKLLPISRISIFISNPDARKQRHTDIQSDPGTLTSYEFGTNS